MEMGIACIVSKSCALFIVHDLFCSLAEQWNSKVDNPIPCGIMTAHNPRLSMEFVYSSRSNYQIAYSVVIVKEMPVASHNHICLCSFPKHADLDMFVRCLGIWGGLL